MAHFAAKCHSLIVEKLLKSIPNKKILKNSAKETKGEIMVRKRSQKYTCFIALSKLV